MSGSEVGAAMSTEDLAAWLSGMWTHYCPRERARISVGAGEPCNWCGAEAGSSTAI
jgi:hypothetical protein